MARPKKLRQSEYDPDLCDRICEMVAEGKTAIQACKDVGIAVRTMYKWRRMFPEFADNFRQARMDAADTFVDRMMEIAETEPDVNRGKLKVDAIKWAAARMNRHVWGDRVEHTGKDGGDIKVEVVDYKNLK